MQHIKADSYRSMPWKNGGGETIEIAVFPEDAGLGAFEWRVSMAAVNSDGPFSEFPQIDRTLSILTGNGMRLQIGRMAYTLDEKSPPLAFAGDVAATATLINGPVTDLNVMTRRGVFKHHVERIACQSDLIFNHRFGTLLVLCTVAATMRTPEGSLSLNALDCVCFDEPTNDIRLHISQPTTVFLVTLSRED
jgi:uncharacterized protein